AHAVEVEIISGDQADEMLQEKLVLSLSSGRVIEVPIVGLTVDKKEEISVSERNLRAVENGNAPHFSGIDTIGNEWKISDFKDKKNVLLTFFPKCFTGGCAGQLASL